MADAGGGLGPTVEKPPTVVRIGAGSPPGIFGYGKDDAGYVIDTSRFERPSIHNKNVDDGDSHLRFEFPLGVEGFEWNGSQGQAIHHYVGDNAAIVEVMHLDDHRINLSGVLPGRTAIVNMRKCRKVLTSVPPVHPAKDKSAYGLELWLPASMVGKHEDNNPYQVFVADYSFNHQEGDRTGSIAYTINFIHVGTREKIDLPKPGRRPPPPNPKGKKIKKSHRTFTVKVGYRTLKTIAKKVYGDANKWHRIYDKNHYVIASGVAFGGLAQPPPPNKIPTTQMMLGLVLNV